MLHFVWPIIVGSKLFPIYNSRKRNKKKGIRRRFSQTVSKCNPPVCCNAFNNGSLFLSFFFYYFFFPHPCFRSRRVQNPGLEVLVALQIVEAGVVLTVVLDAVAPLNLALLVCVYDHKALSYTCISVEADLEFPYILLASPHSYLVICYYLHFQSLELCVVNLHTKRKMNQTASQFHLLLLVQL